MPLSAACFTKPGDDVVGIVRVADRVRAAQEHLETDVRHALAQQAQALPRIFAEEAHRRVEGRAAPHFQREQLRRAARHRARDRQHVVGAHARRHQRLVRVAERRVGDEQALLLAASTRRISSARVRAAAGACPAAAPALRSHAGSGAASSGCCGLVALRVRVAVDDDVAEEVEQLRRAVAARLELEQLRRSCRSASSSPGRCGTFGWRMTFSRNGMFVFTPRMRNSRSARSMRSQRHVEGLAAAR